MRGVTADVRGAVLGAWRDALLLEGLGETFGAAMLTLRLSLSVDSML